MTLAEFTRNTPVGWLRITGGTLDLTRATYSLDSAKPDAEPGGIREAYVPLVSREGEPQAAVVVWTGEPKTLRVLGEWERQNDPHGNVPPVERSRWLEKNRSSLFPHWDVVGVVGTPKDVDGTVAEGMAALKGTLAPRWRWIRDEDVSAKSRGSLMGVGIFLMALPLLLWSACLLRWLLGRRAERQLHLVSAEINRQQALQQTYKFRDKEDILHRGVDGNTLRLLLQRQQISADTLVQNDGTGAISPIQSLPELME